MPKLFKREFGEGEPLIILHGLMGSSDNWVTLGKQYAEKFHVIIPDQRNHGQSFHSDEFDYNQMSDDLLELIDEMGIRKAHLLGHSMGGKVVMQFALENPQKVNRLLVADMVPKSYRVDYETIFKALNAVDLNALASRSEAENIVSKYIEEFGVRQFLLKNLTRIDDGYRWKANLEVIQRDIQKMGDWQNSNKTFKGETLFLMGSKSGYYKEGDESIMETFFPNSQLQFIEAGHWLHAEKPDQFFEASKAFLL
ncbi:MAG: alpha/beta fold hydrolase [Cyclobacteriaceae bacterium]